MLTKKASLKNKVTVGTANATKSASDGSHDKEANRPLQQLTKALSSALVKSSEIEPVVNKKSNPSTRVIIKYDVGYANQLYIRGKGANLSWHKGQLLKNVKADEWLWETDEPFTLCEFKILLNDSVYEAGDNHLVRSGVTLLYRPHFDL